jgi:hypothetical protein
MNQEDTELFVWLPWPDPLTSQNRPTFSRGGRMAQHRAVKMMRESAYVRALEAMDRRHRKYAKARCMIRLFPPDNRWRDGWNYAAMMKGAIDGIIDAGILPNDRDIVAGSWEWGDVRTGGQVLIVIQEAVSGLAKGE